MNTLTFPVLDLETEFVENGTLILRHISEPFAIGDHLHVLVNPAWGVAGIAAVKINTAILHAAMYKVDARQWHGLRLVDGAWEVQKIDVVTPPPRGTSV